MVGVIATGGAAFAANTTVLDSAISSVQGPLTLADTIVPFANLSIELTFPGEVAGDTTVLDSTGSSVPTDTSVPVTDLLEGSTTTIVAALTPVATVTPAPGATFAPSSVQLAYNIPSVGLITLNHYATSLKIVSVNPVSGWTFDAEYINATRVEVEFENDNRIVMFRAELLDGRVIAAVSEDNGDDGDDSTKDTETETAAKIAADATERAAKATYDATERAAKATYDATERAAKATFESAESAAEENSDEAALTAAKETFETAVSTALETFETALSTALETFETALRTARESLESADD